MRMCASFAYKLSVCCLKMIKTILFKELVITSYAFFLAICGCRTKNTGYTFAAKLSRFRLIGALVGIFLS